MSPKRHRKCFTKARVTGDSQGSSWCFCVHRWAVTATIARAGHQGWDLSWVKVCVIPTSKKPRPAEGLLNNEVSLEGWEGRRWWVSLATLGPQQYAIVSCLTAPMAIISLSFKNLWPATTLKNQWYDRGTRELSDKETCYTRCRPVPQIHYPWGYSSRHFQSASLCQETFSKTPQTSPPSCIPGLKCRGVHISRSNPH